jgi:hypothetical protein
MKFVVAIVAALVLADVAFAGVLVANRASAPSLVAAQASPHSGGQAKTHPCNHGFYVSQAAHAKKGGKSVSGVAQSNLGKDGNCSAKLPGS